MKSHLHKKEILEQSKEIFHSITGICREMEDHAFFYCVEHQWSVAEHLEHLTRCIKVSSRAFYFPKFLLLWTAGRPTRISSTYQGLVKRYEKKLVQFPGTTRAFKPKVSGYTRVELVDRWEKQYRLYLSGLKHKRTNYNLDDYLVKHPKLGRITLRELCYFNMHHSNHHLSTMKKLAGSLIHS